MKTLDFARHLRAESTDVERIIWRELRSHRFQGLKFKRQQPIDHYVVDFVCFETRLVIELDGGQHAEAVAYDKERDSHLRASGFTILRFWNNDVVHNLEGVLESILMHCGRAPSPLAPLPQGERGNTSMRATHSTPLPPRGRGAGGRKREFAKHGFAPLERASDAARAPDEGEP